MITQTSYFQTRDVAWTFFTLHENSDQGKMVGFPSLGRLDARGWSVQWKGV